ncbi:MAG: radical SAM family heme chaperone HemW [Bacteroidia bacterium]
MAGIYIHIPYCKQACVYCNFHFSTQLTTTQLMVDSIVTELELRTTYFEPHTPIHTIYFGGGTPSVLTVAQLQTIITAIQKNYNCAELQELTIEANPDDLSIDYLKQLKQHTPVNRLSIGVQSFNDDELIFFNRAHNSAQIHQALRNAQLVGFTNISIDLIFGSPVSTTASWLRNLQLTDEYGVQHLSCYSLTVEEKTALAHRVNYTKQVTLNESFNNQQFQTLMEYATHNNWTQYEISNYCKQGFESKHNTSYWQGKTFMGVGPAAHSYNGATRSFNIHNNNVYIKAMQNKDLTASVDTTETLSVSEQYNEYVMTRLRTIQGVNSIELQQLFGTEKLTYFETEIAHEIHKGNINFKHFNYTLTTAGKYIADSVASNLFWV